jgi:hypothetical protein
MMGHLFHYIIFMKQTLKNFWLLSLLMAFGCAHAPEEPPKQTKAQKFQFMHPEERHIWLPPSEEELEARRQRQKRLDVIAADLERLFMGFADILGDEIILENLLRGKEPELQQLEARLAQQEAEEERIKKFIQSPAGRLPPCHPVIPQWRIPEKHCRVPADSGERTFGRLG